MTLRLAHGFITDNAFRPSAGHARGGIRTPMSLGTIGFKPIAYAIPPPGRIGPSGANASACRKRLRRSALESISVRCCPMSVVTNDRAGASTASRTIRRDTFSPAMVGLLVAGLAVELGLLAAWQRNGYWDFSDGVYAQSAREFLHGLVPYRDFAAAQPPAIYLVGVALLAVHDGLVSLRLGAGLVDLLTAALVAVCVWRLSGRRWLAIASAAAAPLLPVSLHEHAQLAPETFAAPLLLGGALCCSRESQARTGAVLLALASLFKLAFVIPAIAIALASPARRRSTVWFVLFAALLAVASVLAFGSPVWREAVEAQLQVGRASTHYAAGLIAQAIWSELVLVIGALAAVVLARREHVQDRELLRTVAAAAGAGLLLVLTVFKRGSYINVLVVAEPAVLVLAACGAAWSWKHWRSSRPVVAALCILLAVQSVSILVSPGDPWAAKRPGAQSGLAWSASPTAVDRKVSAARRCGRDIAYSADPYYAFLAARRMPGNQPDLFMLEYARIDAKFARQAGGDQPRCP